MTPESAIGLAKKAEGIGDRGLFLVALVVLVVAAYYVFRHVMGLVKEMKDQLVELYSEANGARVAVASVLAEHGVLTKECAQELKLTREEGRKQTEFLSRAMDRLERVDRKHEQRKEDR